MGIETIERQFDSVAKEYDAGRRKFIPCFDDFYKTMTGFLCFAVKETKAVLDLGAGTGLLTGLIYDTYPNARYTLVDISKDMMEIARRRFSGCPNVEFRIFDYTKKLPGGSYDLIASALSIHHLPDEDKTKLYRNIYDALPAGGWFVNFDQFDAVSQEMNALYNTWWYASIRESGLPQEEYDKWLVRRKLDRENSIDQTTRMLKHAGFKLAECIYSYMKFGVVLARKTEGA